MGNLLFLVFKNMQVLMLVARLFCGVGKMQVGHLLLLLMFLQVAEPIELTHQTQDMCQLHADHLMLGNGTVTLQRLMVLKRVLLLTTKQIQRLLAQHQQMGLPPMAIGY